MYTKKWISFDSFFRNVDKPHSQVNKEKKLKNVKILKNIEKAKYESANL